MQNVKLLLKNTRSVQKQQDILSSQIEQIYTKNVLILPLIYEYDYKNSTYNVIFKRKLLNFFSQCSTSSRQFLKFMWKINTEESLGKFCPNEKCIIREKVSLSELKTMKVLSGTQWDLFSVLLPCYSALFCDVSFWLLYWLSVICLPINLVVTLKDMPSAFPVAQKVKNLPIMMMIWV